MADGAVPLRRSSSIDWLPVQDPRPPGSTRTFPAIFQAIFNSRNVIEKRRSKGNENRKRKRKRQEKSRVGVDFRPRKGWEGGGMVNKDSQEVSEDDRKYSGQAKNVHRCHGVGGAHRSRGR